MGSHKLLIISPCRDEAEFIRQTLDSVIAQSVRPTLWLIVDDGSTDASPAIVADYAKRYPFIQTLRLVDRGYRRVGAGVIEAFSAGYSHVNAAEFDYLCKLDLDLRLPQRYFEILLRRCDENPRIGTCSGKPYFLAKGNGALISEKCGDENSVGMTKFYRKACFDQIGGFIPQVMWDGIDGHRCRMLGWVARSWDEPELRFIHLRAMGSSHKSILTGRMRHGFGQYFMGTGFVYMTISALYRMTRPPLVLGGIAMWLGYVKSLLARQQRLDDPAFRRFLRSYQRSCLLLGKKRATAILDARGASLWKPRAAPSSQPAWSRQ